MNKTKHIVNEMIHYFAGDAKRVQHFIKVHSLAKLIGELEGLEATTQYILEVAAIVHDIGIKIAEEKYGECNGKLQEKEGPKVAQSLLSKLGVDSDTIERVCYLVGHHHTYKDIVGMDYQILIEADFLVNIYEDGLSVQAIKAAYKNIFRTDTGKELCRTLYDLD